VLAYDAIMLQKAPTENSSNNMSDAITCNDSLLDARQNEATIIRNCFAKLLD